MNSYLLRPMLGAAALASVLTAAADTRPDDHAPIGVMGDHTHHAGEVMFSYRYMHMSMEGNRDGTSSISAPEIVTQAANPFANPPMMPPTLRVVPLDMDMDMHMVGVMYAPSDRITLALMGNYVEQRMTHRTYQGPMGTTPLGTFTTRTSGFGDTALSALLPVYETPQHRVHVTAGVSLPTGDIEERDDVLAPTGARPTLRLPYPMQLGSGTYDLITGVTYAGFSERMSWGAQWRSTLRIGENDEDYTLGDLHELSAWVGRRLGEVTSISARLSYGYRGNIDGMDPRIRAPVQTADPDRQGYDRVDLGLGLNVRPGGAKHRLALEVMAPIYQDLDGPQLEQDWRLTLGWQYTP